MAEVYRELDLTQSAVARESCRYVRTWVPTRAHVGADGPRGATPGPLSAPGALSVYSG